ncbi:MAG: monovalent cation/H(+) antiporter subunit G [Chloroflexi bacterium]|jgi:multicomponent Na+:H+ antiporter subunit G|nr:monovalent cation/H(+) antiporter subunit G [Chloroflexota bacterium]
MREILVYILLFSGASLLLLAAVGVNRMPDLISRIQAAAKASSLGSGLMVMALAVYFSDFGVTVRALLILAFLFLTVPVSGHVLGRAAYFIGVPLWEHTIIDELKGRYDTETHELGSPGETDDLQAAQSK